MFIIFEDVEGKTQIINDRFVEFIGYNDDGEIVIDAQNWCFPISKEQYCNIIKQLTITSEIHPAINCVMPRKFEEL